METLKGLLLLIRALPEILKLIENIQKRIDDQQLETKIHEDIKKINSAFENQDEKALQDLFNNK